MSHLQIRDFVLKLFQSAIEVEIGSPKVGKLLCDAAALLISKACEINRLRSLLAECAPHIIASHGAEHMLDGFLPTHRPVDDLVARIKAILNPEAQGD